MPSLSHVPKFRKVISSYKYFHQICPKNAGCGFGWEKRSQSLMRQNLFYSVSSPTFLFFLLFCFLIFSLKMQQVYVGGSRGLRRRGRRTKCAGKQGIVRPAGAPHTAAQGKCRTTLHWATHYSTGQASAGTHTAASAGAHTAQCTQSSCSGKYSETYDTNTHLQCTALKVHFVQCVAVIFDIS